MNNKRKQACYQIHNEATSKKKWSGYFHDIAQEYRGSNCTCGCCVVEAIKKSGDRKRQRIIDSADSSKDTREEILNEYSFEKDDGPRACTCIFCSTYSYTETSEEVLKDQVTKLGKENIPTCRVKMLHPERKFFRYASLREKRLARAKNEQVYGNEGTSSDDSGDNKETDTRDWSID